MLVRPPLEVKGRKVQRVTVGVLQVHEGACTKSKGDCPFGHRKATADETKEKASWDAKRAARPAPQAEVKVCTDRKKKGECALGDACKFSHPKNKQRWGKGKRSA